MLTRLVPSSTRWCVYDSQLCLNKRVECSHIPHVQSAQMAEAMALREGLQMVEELGCHRVEAESESSETIQACTGEQRWWCSAAAIYADCVDIASKIGDVTFRQCPREANKAAHEIAHYSFSNNISCNWVDVTIL
jgi:ribonuclease HI